MEEDQDTTSKSAASELFKALLSGVVSRLNVRELCALRLTCLEGAAASLLPEYWASLDLTPLANPGSFLESEFAHSARFEAVRTLTIEFCSELTDSHLEALPLWPLESLSLNACHNVTDKGIKAVLKRCGRKLRRLSIYWNSKASKAAAVAVSLFCPQLTSLSLSGCQHIASEGLLAIASRCRKLQHVNLTRLVQIEDFALSELVQARALDAEHLMVGNSVVEA